MYYDSCNIIGDVYVMVLNRKINTFTTDFIRKINEKLDVVENSGDSECALITVSSNEKFFSTGLDLKYIFIFKSKFKLYFIN